MSTTPRTLHQHIRSGEWTWCGIRWKHAAQSSDLPFCKWCVKSARKSGVIVDAPLDGATPLRNVTIDEMGSMHGRDGCQCRVCLPVGRNGLPSGGAAPSVAEKLPACSDECEFPPCFTAGCVKGRP